MDKASDTDIRRLPLEDHIDIIPARQLTHDRSQIHIAEFKTAVLPGHHFVRIGAVDDPDLTAIIAEYGLLPGP